MARTASDEVLSLKERMADGGAIHDGIERKVRTGSGTSSSLVCNIPKHARSAVGFEAGDEVEIAVFADGVFIRPKRGDSQ